VKKRRGERAANLGGNSPTDARIASTRGPSFLRSRSFICREVNEGLRIEERQENGARYARGAKADSVTTKL